MTMAIGRIHHITAIASAPDRNLAFYEGALGLRLIKQTVNFDDPGVHHLYYGDETGTPGTILTFFPYPGARAGRHGAGQAAEIALAIPEGSLGFWQDRLAGLRLAVEGPAERFGERLIALKDHDGLMLELVEDEAAAALPGRAAEGIPAEHAIRGLRGIALWVEDAAGTAQVLSEVLGHEPGPVEGNRSRFVHPGAGLGRIVDLRAVPGFWAGAMGAGVVHHVAFRAADDAAQAAATAALAARGIRVTPQQDRTYFRSTYFREPGGVLFEIATDAPGFAIDEPVAALGSRLMLPARYEPHRAAIEANLPRLHPAHDTA
ncbi:VOC family protein [Elioraea sp. Yellowstone]|jgi:glyoxalase family protein|uniref:VOC family protein n=1 Tax=Elioraea sp. Yellowstone TaxID=2592070 RepID=UPI001F1FCAB6|nr:VOC family protein [Elioraea sp. Yellowstone]